MKLYLDGELGRNWEGRNVFELVQALDGKVYREVESRRTLQFDYGGRSYFLKLHRGVGWREIIKNLLQARLPVISAENEWRAIRRLHELGIDTMRIVAFGVRGWNPARRQSFIVTEALEETTSLEDYCAGWETDPPAFSEKKALVEKVAAISRRMHVGGVCHRDFYICHFLLDRSVNKSAGTVSPKLFLIDLHRALCKGRLGRRWVEKDIAGLYFSSREIGLTRRDLFRFIRVYADAGLRETLQGQGQFWNRVASKGETLYRKLGNPQRAGS